MSYRQRVLEILTQPFHKVHPALALPVVALGGWLAAPMLPLGNAEKAMPSETTGSAPQAQNPGSPGGTAPPYGVAGVAPAPPPLQIAAPTVAPLSGISINTGSGSPGSSRGGGSPA